MGSQSTPRTTALCILNRVDSGAWADQLLRRHLTADRFDARDRGFITELVFGVLRHRMLLDHYLAQLSDRPLQRLDHAVLNALRMGAYQILNLRVPAYAACDRTVRSVQEVGLGRAKGFVNAVLRSLVRQKDQLQLPPRDKDPIRWLAVKESHPEWIVREWVQRFGWEQTEKLCAANNAPPEVSLRANQLKNTREELADRLKKQGICVRPSPLTPDGLLYRNGGLPGDLEAFQKGMLSIQSQSSQLAVQVCPVKKEDRILDLCAGRGGKTTYLAEKMGDAGEVVAVDRHRGKLDQLVQECDRLGIESVRTRCADATSLTPEDVGLFDLVLVDAPCSTTGNFGRRPDARWRKSPRLADRLSELQDQLLRAAAQLVKPGGFLVYCTCSLLVQENEQVVKRFATGHGDFTGDDFGADLTSRISADTEHPYRVTLLPHLHGTDGFFMARYRRRARG